MINTITTKYQPGTLTYKTDTETKTITGLFRQIERHGTTQIGYRARGTISPGSPEWICTTNDVIEFKQEGN